MRALTRTLAITLLTATWTAHGGENNIDLDRLTSHYGAQAQSVFRLMSEDLSSALSYKALAPAEPLGWSGFDAGIEVTATSMHNADEWSQAVSKREAVRTLPVPKLHVHKGLPLNIDIGAMLSAVPSTNIRLFGGELRLAIIDGSATLPAVAVRGTVSRLSGVDRLALLTKGVELTVSKGIAMFTPYAGVGSVWTNADPEIATGLEEEEFRQNKFFAGLNVSFGVTNIAIEGDRTGDSSTYGGKIGLRF